MFNPVTTIEQDTNSRLVQMQIKSNDKNNNFISSLFQPEIKPLENNNSSSTAIR